jgi:hypothetical protein
MAASWSSLQPMTVCWFSSGLHPRPAWTYLNSSTSVVGDRQPVTTLIQARSRLLDRLWEAPALPSRPDAASLPIDPTAERRKRALLDAALTLLLHRAGGRLSFTEAEYHAVLDSYGGSARMNMHYEIVRQDGQPDRVEFRLEDKPARNAELPV